MKLYLMRGYDEAFGNKYWWLLWLGMGYKAVEKQVVESIETSKYKGYEPPSTKKLFPTAMNLRKQ